MCLLLVGVVAAAEVQGLRSLRAQGAAALVDLSRARALACRSTQARYCLFRLARVGLVEIARLPQPEGMVPLRVLMGCPLQGVVAVESSACPEEAAAPVAVAGAATCRADLV